MVTLVRGPRGGYRLARNAQDIAVSQVAAAEKPNQTEDLEPSDRSGQASSVQGMTLGLAARLHRHSLHSEAYRYSDSRLSEKAAIHP